jgi:hypothetical protein
MGAEAAKMGEHAAQMIKCAPQTSETSLETTGGSVPSTLPSMKAVGYELGDRVVCLGTAFGRYEKGQNGTICRVDDSAQQALVLLDGRFEPILIGQACFEHADGIEWELADSSNKFKRRTPLPCSVKRGQELEESIQELFRKQDLNGNGVLEEAELIKLNQRICYLHHGSDDKKMRSVKEDMTKLFREHLNVRGDSIVYPLFREYILHQLDTEDPDERAQIMIVEQWIAEADSGREAFALCSVSSETDFAYIPRKQIPLVA